MSEWKTIESAPHDKPIMVWDSRWGNCQVVNYLSGEHGPGWCTFDAIEVFKPSHWMELPNPPETSNGN